MAIYVTTVPTLIHPEKPFHMGDKIGEAQFVTEIQVDNTELEYIRESIPGLPIPNKRVVKFYGDTAKMIIGNLFPGNNFT